MLFYSFYLFGHTLYQLPVLIMILGLLLVVYFIQSTLYSNFSWLSCQCLL